MEPRSSTTTRRARIELGAAISVVLLVLCALLAVGEMRYRTCIARAEAQYPAVPVSAFSGRATGPVKVSFVAERERAVKDCGRI